MNIHGIRFRLNRFLSLLLITAMTVSLMPFDCIAAGTGKTESYRLENGGLIPVADAGSDSQAVTDDGSLLLDNVSRPASTPLMTKLVEVYSTYMFFNALYAPGGMSKLNGLVLGYSADNGNTWSVYPEIIGYYDSVTVSGLTPNTDYLIRLMNPRGVHLGDFRVHTGMPDLKIKSVTAQAVKVKHRRERKRTPYLGLPLRGYWYYYTYKVKITVKLKKKPGTPGIYINGIWVPGNKKKYRVTIPILYNTFPKNKSPKNRVKYQVSVYSGFDPSEGGYGGFSPLWQKTKKLR